LSETGNKAYDTTSNVFSNAKEGLGNKASEFSSGVKDKMGETGGKVYDTVTSPFRKAYNKLA